MPTSDTDNVPQVVVPTVHLNGTSKDELYKQVVNVYKALDAVIDALRAASPHGRDYYVFDDVMFSAAQHDHRHRMLIITNMQQQMIAIAEGIQDQGTQS